MYIYYIIYNYNTDKTDIVIIIVSRPELIKSPARLFSITAAWCRLLALHPGHAELELDDCWAVVLLPLVDHEHELPLSHHAVGSLLVRSSHILQTTKRTEYFSGIIAVFLP